MHVEPITAWRYMSMRKFDDLLARRALFFCPIRRFIDRYEGFIHEDLQEELFRLMSPIIGGEECVLWTLEDAKLSILDSCFVSCWTYWESEQKSLWDTYVGNEVGIVLKTDVERLHVALAPEAGGRLICKPVWYSDEANGRAHRLHAPAFREDFASLSPYAMAFFSRASYDAPDVLTHLQDYRFVFTKRVEFEGEREFRFVVAVDHGIDFHQWRQLIQSVGVEYGTAGALHHLYVNSEDEIRQIRRRPPPAGKLIPFDLSAVDEIRVSPAAPPSFVATVETELAQHELGSIVVRMSELATK